MKLHSKVAAVGLVVVLGALGNPSQATATRDAGGEEDGASAVRAWNAVAMTTLVAASTSAVEQPLHLAAMHRAIYDAVRVARRPGHPSSVTAAIGEAARDVLAAEFPDQTARLDSELAASLAALPAGRFLDAGLAVGRRAAAAALAERAGDGRNGPVVPVPPAAPGVWAPAPPNTLGVSSWLGGVRPFVLSAGSDVRPAGPPALTSQRWARDYNETRVYGAALSTRRTPEETEVARFWADPPFVQNQRALRAYSESNQLGVLRTARLFALTDTASADALIACFDAKYHFELWRPVAAIPGGDTDGNPATPADATWQPLVGTPNFPEYTSAHSCSTTAIATVVAALAPRHRFDFTMTSTVTGTTHHYSSVRELTDEVADARVWGGLHWRFSTDDGTTLGRRVALAVLRAGEDRSGSLCGLLG